MGMSEKLLHTVIHSHEYMLVAYLTKHCQGREDFEVVL